MTFARIFIQPKDALLHDHGIYHGHTVFHKKCGKLGSKTIKITRLNLNDLAVARNIRDMRADLDLVKIRIAFKISFQYRVERFFALRTDADTLALRYEPRIADFFKPCLVHRILLRVRCSYFNIFFIKCKDKKSPSA
jgi:hypothetical protein